jgi:hypothetical protein
MMVDIQVNIDDNPIILKHPLLPYGNHTQVIGGRTVLYSSYRIPVFVKYNPQIENWPEPPYYNTENLEIAGVLIAGRRYNQTPKVNNQFVLIPRLGQYTLHVEQGATYIVIGFSQEQLFYLTRIEIIATSISFWSLYGVSDPDGDQNLPMVLTTPNINKKADALKYARFSFESIKMSFIKEKQSIFLYGGEMALMLKYQKEDDENIGEYNLGRYIINNISYDMNKADIDGIDYRYLLNLKYPNETFTNHPVTGHPYIQNDYIDTVKPAMIGIGSGIPGIPLNGLQIYDETNGSLFPENKIIYYDYQFPPGWLTTAEAMKNFKIERKVDGTWTEIYPGLGNPQIQDGNAKYNPRNPVIPTKIPTGRDSNNEIITKTEYKEPVILDSTTGKVRVHFMQALPNGEYGSDPLELRMYAEWPNKSMKDAITALLGYTGDPSILNGFSGEFAGLGDVGLYMNDSDSIFTWVEKLQSANVIGGQLMLVNDVLKFRLENPNRNIKKRKDGSDLAISATDALNHEVLPIKIADDFMYSGYEVEWTKAVAGEEIGKIVGINPIYPTAPIYNGIDSTAKYVRVLDKNDNPRNSYFNIEKTQQRINIINDLIKRFRHKIVGLEVPMTPDYMELLVFDVIEYLPKTLEETNKKYEWIIYEKKYDLKQETILLALIERVKTQAWNDGNE